MNKEDKERLIKETLNELEATRLPDLPENPEKGRWYRLPLSRCVNGCGGAHHANIKIGLEKKLIIYFMGGGASWNTFTAARPLNIYNLYDENREAFYFDNADPFSDNTVVKGIGSVQPENPFRNWSMISINYSTGDFHIGCNEYIYTSLDGKEKVLYHHGYKNYREALKCAMQFIEYPEQLVLMGGSAGGFAVAALADDVIQQFFECKNITCCIDSSVLLHNWKSVTKNVWKASEEICNLISSDNLTLDCWKKLYEKYNNQIKYLFCCSPRDGELARYQSYLDGNGAVFSKEAGDRFYHILCEMVEELLTVIPEVGLFFFDKFLFEGTNPEDCLMQHTITLSDNVFEKTEDEKSVADWILDAVNGNIEKIGLSVLEKE